MKGAFAINQWLIEKKLLRIRNPKLLKTKDQVRFEDLDVDWDSTIAWAWGGYYSRVFLNVEGREPKGVISQSEYESVRDEVAEQIKRITGPDGERWNTAVYYPEDIYPKTIGDKPDMLVYLDNLSWRAAGTLGYDSEYLSENDIGPDDAVHSRYGIFALHTPEMNASKPASISIYDFAPTVLSLFNIKKEFRGNSII